MKQEQIQLLIQQYKLLQREPGKEQSALAEAALFLEESFPITLTDNDICEENLGSLAAMEALIMKRLGKE